MISIIILFIIYIVGILIYTEHASFNNINVTPRVARKSLLWPVLFVLWIVKPIFCKLLNFLFLVFGYTEYKNSKFYKFMNEKLERFMKCPICKDNSYKVIYYGLPVHFCKNKECNCMFGFWFYITDFLPFNGFLFIYEGSYLIALYRWLKGN